MSNIRAFIVNQEYKADYRVYFVNSSYQEKNSELLKGGVLVDQEHKATIKVFIVNQEYKATIKIMQKNFPK